MPNAINNQVFAAAIGCHHSMASRIITGKRLPSLELMAKIEEAYDVPMAAQVKARAKGPEAYGRLITARVIAPANAAAKRDAKEKAKLARASA